MIRGDLVRAAFPVDRCCLIRSMKRTTAFPILVGVLLTTAAWFALTPTIQTREGSNLRASDRSATARMERLRTIVHEATAAAAARPARETSTPPIAAASPMCATVRRAANDRNQILLALGDSGYVKPRGPVDPFLRGLASAGVRNVVIWAMDADAVRYMARKHGGVAVISEATKSKTKYEVSDKKFPMLVRLLEQCQVSVLLLDMDITVFGNPFAYIVDDADFEAMTDGATSALMFGSGVKLPHKDPQTPKGWFRPWVWRSAFFNSGCFYAKRGAKTIAALRAVSAIIAQEKLWDQQALNVVLHARPGGGGGGGRVPAGVSASVRVMNPLVFATSQLWAVAWVKPRVILAGDAACAPDARRLDCDDARTRPSFLRKAVPAFAPVLLHANFHTGQNYEGGKHALLRDAAALRARGGRPMPPAACRGGVFAEGCAARETLAYLDEGHRSFLVDRAMKVLLQA